ncbi:MAG: heme NO-binding domain-containing protein [Deltaproteobacteria bacterium]|nr:heme NO-binding domain-containing protein [Deltaproteobacteria bacterium]MBW1871255.1 heme NO-binding domain-containing protein [Deltaproteobacteria bacterium]
MKGIINKGIQELVEAKFGAQAWEKVRELAKCEELFFSVSEDYPDQTTQNLVTAVCEVSGLSLETVLLDFGKFWVSNTAVETYPTFFKLAGKTAREFLLNMDRVHKQVTKNIHNAKPPSFEYEEFPDGRLLMHYRSERGLCTILRGIILGVGVFFNEELQVEETSCMHNGAPRCSIEVSFP